MRKKISATTVSFVILLGVFIAYMGYSIIQSFSDKIKTVDAVLVEVDDKISSDGVFIRNQKLVVGSPTKATEYLVENGEKVANGDKIVIFFNDIQSLEKYRQSAILFDKIESNKYAYEHMTGGADGLKLDGLIMRNLLTITRGIENGSIHTINENYSDLKQLVVQRDGDEISQSEYNEMQKSLNIEYRALQSQINDNSSTAFSESSGYFIMGTDGYETVLTEDTIDSLTPDILSKLPMYCKQEEGNYIGSIVEGYEWYLAAAIPNEDAIDFEEGQSFKISFAQNSLEPLKMKIDTIIRQNQQETILVFKSDIMQAGYITARQEPIDIIKTTYMGIKVPKEALRQVDGEWGVYCLVGAIVKFKPVEWVYQTDSYYLVIPAESSKKGLYQYDKIIVEGKNIEKGMVID